MRIVRWILLVLYLGLVFGLFALGMWQSEIRVGVWIVLGITIAADALFILGAGNKDLFRPIRRRRFLLPLAAASFMLAVLVGGLTLSLGELFRVSDAGSAWEFWGPIGTCWIFWGILLYAYARQLSRYQAIFRLSKLVFAGSLAELLAAAPAHIIVSRRTGCFVGIATGIGVLAGLYVMIWSFGPAIFLLFLQEARRRESRQMPAIGYEAPPLNRPFQYRLRTLLLVMLATNIVSAMLKTFWLQWPAAAIMALVCLTLAATLFAASRWLLLVPATLGMLVGVAWAFWGQWTMLAILTVPMGILIVLQAKLSVARPLLPRGVGTFHPFQFGKEQVGTRLRLHAPQSLGNQAAPFQIVATRHPQSQEEYARFVPPVSAHGAEHIQA